MKIHLRARTAGNAMLLALFTTFVISIALSSYLYLVSNQNRTVFRSMAWNSVIPVVEAGVEEALTQLHYTGANNLAANGWASSGDGFYHKTNDLGNGFSYDVGIKPPPPGSPDQPTIECLGYAAAPANYTSYYQSTWGMILGSGLVPQFTPTKASSKRKVRVLAKRQTPASYSNLAKGLIDLNGNNVSTDSFISNDPAYSTNGRYDSAKARDHGDVATNSGIVNAVKAGNADVKGHVGTGPNGSVDIGSNGAIGDKAWVESGHTGVMPGWVTGPTYDYILYAPLNYRIPDLHGQVLIVGSGTTEVYVSSSFNMSGQDQITVSTGTKVQLYVAAASAKIGGKGVVNVDGDALGFQYYGLPTNTSLNFQANAAFTGTIYAPNADFALGGGGNNTYDFIGATVTKTLTMTGHFHFHYDESLSQRFPIRDYVVFSWNEIDPNGTN